MPFHLVSNTRKQISDFRKKNRTRTFRICVLFSFLGFGLIISWCFQAEELSAIFMIEIQGYTETIILSTNDKKKETVEVSTSREQPIQVELGKQAQTQENTRSLEGKTELRIAPESSEGPKQSSQQRNTDSNKVHFLNETHLTILDSFSASWLQSKTDFLGMDLDSIRGCEDAAFKAWRTRMHKLRQPVDLLDFSVEHLSRWWTVLKAFDKDDPIPLESITQKLDAYIKHGSEFPGRPNNLTLKNTLAMIAFLPLRSKQLTTLSLGSTIESLRRAEMGRVVVVMLEGEDERYATDTFQYIVDSIPSLEYEKNSNGIVSQLSHMEVSYIKMPKDKAESTAVKKNVPKASLVGVREAILMSQLSNIPKTDNQTKYMRQWFGETHGAEFWRYLYLTEPDSILQSRPTTLQQIKDEVDGGSIVVPHRLQPMPHESDIRGSKDKSLYLNEDDGFEEVIELDAHSDHDVCCDDQERPGLDAFPTCPKNFRWWSCGLRIHDPNDSDPQKRIRPYKLMRLTQGVGLTTIAGTLHARRCVPAKKSYCDPSDRKRIAV